MRRHACLVVWLSACDFSGATGSSVVGDGAIADGTELDATIAIDASALDAPPPDAAVTRRSCREILEADPDSVDGPYPIDPDGDAGPGAPFSTFCDMTGGGWTLVGKVDGRPTNHDTWLRAPVDVAALASPVIADDTYACVDAIELAVNGATEIRLANSARDRWVTWPLPAGRTTATWWNHAAGQTAIDNAAKPNVTVTASTGGTATCKQSVYGINPWDLHGGAYPSTHVNTAGNTAGADWCMSVGTMATGAPAAHGFSQNGNGFDAPSDDATWPNANYNVDVRVSVWLR